MTRRARVAAAVGHRASGTLPAVLSRRSVPIPRNQQAELPGDRPRGGCR